MAAPTRHGDRRHVVHVPSHDLRDEHKDVVTPIACAAVAVGSRLSPSNSAAADCPACQPRILPRAHDGGKSRPPLTWSSNLRKRQKRQRRHRTQRQPLRQRVPLLGLSGARARARLRRRSPANPPHRSPPPARARTLSSRARPPSRPRPRRHHHPSRAPFVVVVVVVVVRLLRALESFSHRARAIDRLASRARDDPRSNRRSTPTPRTSTTRDMSIVGRHTVPSVAHSAPIHRSTRIIDKRAKRGAGIFRLGRRGE